MPVGLGLLWLPSLRRARRGWPAFMALTAGLLSFLAVEALSEALELQATLPGGLGGAGLVLLGVAISFLMLTFLSRLAGRAQRGALGGLGLATLVAVGIGVHNLGEGLAIGSSFSLGELTLGTFLIVGFMVHNVTEGLAIATPVAEAAQRPGRARRARARRRRRRRSSGPGSAASSPATSSASSSSPRPPARPPGRHRGRTYVARRAPGGITLRATPSAASSPASR